MTHSSSQIHESLPPARRGRASGALLIALAALIAGLLAILMRQDSPAQTRGVDATLGLRGESESVEPDSIEEPPARDESKAIEDGAEERQRVEVELPGTEPVKAPTYHLELQVVNSEGLVVRGASVQVLEPSMDGDTVLAANGIATLKLAGLVSHVIEITGPEEGDLRYIEQTVRWVPTPGKSVGQLEVVLRRAARIQGSLHCSDGSSARSAGIDIFHIETKTWTNAAAIEDGTFVSQWIPHGDVIVYSRNGSWSDDDLKERVRITLGEGQTYSYQGRLAPAIDLIGTVVDGAGRPLENIPVDVYDEANPIYSESVISGTDGRFLCDGLYPGTYLLDLPGSARTPKVRFTVLRGRESVDMGHLVHRKR